MQRALDGGREQRRERRRATRIRAAELPEDLTLAGDRGVETGGDAEEVRHRGGLGPDDHRIHELGRLDRPTEPGASIAFRGETAEDLDAVTRDEPERAPLGRARHGCREALTRGDRRVSLMERPGNECFRDASTLGTVTRVANLAGRFA